MNVIDWFANLWLIPPRSLHVLGLIWLFIMVFFTFNKFKGDIPLTSLRNAARMTVLTVLLCYACHLFYDLWAIGILFVVHGGVYHWINPFSVFYRVTNDGLIIFIIYYMLTSPKFSSDFKTLLKIKLLGNRKFRVINIVIFIYHLILLQWGILTIGLTSSPYEFYAGYMTMKILLFLAYWSIWTK